MTKKLGYVSRLGNSCKRTSSCYFLSLYTIIIIILSLRTKVFGFLRTQNCRRVVRSRYCKLGSKLVNQKQSHKCKELRISFTSDCDFPPVVIGEECIKLVKDAKLLGVTISGDLTWNAQITEVTEKAAKRLYFLVQLKRDRVPQKDLCLFYITCVRSVIHYAAPVFHHALPAYLSQELKRVQKRAM